MVDNWTTNQCVIVDAKFLRFFLNSDSNLIDFHSYIKFELALSTNGLLIFLSQVR